MPTVRTDDADDDEQLDAYVRQFERAYRARGGADPAEFLPPPGHRLRPVALRELVRVDLEFGWGRGRPRPLADYRRDLPELEADAEGLREVAFEEYRLRLQAGDAPSAQEYRDRYGLDVGPSIRRADPDPGPGPGRAGDTAEAPAMPEVGEVFLGFHLMAELGRGSFGRVYLARQGELADREVVLKVTADGPDESQTLAQLQHDHIVPIYSRHREGRLRAVCMPYLGSVTLRDVCEGLKAQGGVPGSGRDLLSSLGKAGRGGGGPTLVAAATVAPQAPPRPPGKTAAGRARGADPGGVAAADPAAPAPPPGAHPHPHPAQGPRGSPAGARAVLGGLPYVEAVVWLAARLADGLAHAHDRGILHRDMKPANILLADDGRPMLLDFNLAEDLKCRPAGGPSAVGGTLPYMAPEHLDAFRDGGRAVDARSDLYAFGVIVFELLTGRPPFPARQGPRAELLRALAADRQGPPPRLRPWNPAVSPAVESVVRRCLEPEPSRRYASARELAEDLERHLSHLPLRHAADPSPRERAGKWVRRHPRSAALAALGAAGLTLAAGLGGPAAARVGRLNGLEAAEALARFDRGARDARVLLYARAGDDDRHGAGVSAARAALAAVGAPAAGGVPGATPWWERPPAGRLPVADRDRLRRDAGELFLALAAEDLRARRPRAALAANSGAGACFGDGPTPRTYWSQRAEALALLGDPGAAARCAGRAAATPRDTARGDYLAGVALIVQRHFAEALPRLEAAARADPGDYWSHLAAGVCHARRREFFEALLCDSLCVTLRPDEPAGWYNRGLLNLRMNRPDEAAADLTRARRLRPDDPDVASNLALAALNSGLPDRAVRWYDHAIALDRPNPRLYLMRARARLAAGDAEGARRDREEGFRLAPTDLAGWVARGNARLAADPADARAAVADFDAALNLYPDAYSAFQSKIATLADRLGATAEAADEADRMVAAYPVDAQALQNRAVLRGRLGRIEGAHADAGAALRLDPGGASLLAAAEAYAQTSQTRPGDAAEAVRLLAAALRKRATTPDLIAADGDLDPIRTTPGFAEAVAAWRP